jgi:hypothetical protein
MAKVEEEKEENRKTAIEVLNTVDLTQEQIVDVLLVLIDDWEVRRAVFVCQNRRAAGPAAGPSVEPTTEKKAA